jgi:hypothetical protein
VFEEAPAALSQRVSGTVAVGTTFRVVLCNCFSSPDPDMVPCDFCSCTCRSCGGERRRQQQYRAQRGGGRDDIGGDGGGDSEPRFAGTRWYLVNMLGSAIVNNAATLGVAVALCLLAYTATDPALLSVVCCGICHAVAVGAAVAA